MTTKYLFTSVYFLGIVGVVWDGGDNVERIKFGTVGGKYNTEPLNDTLIQ